MLHLPMRFLEDMKSDHNHGKIRVFELYLLSVMRVSSAQLQNALDELHASKTDLEICKQTMIDIGIESIGVTAALYRDILGGPFEVNRIDDSTIPSSFQGSSSLHFKLPLWQEFDFVVNEHPDGRAWDPSFKRPIANRRMPQLNSVSDLEPWKFVKEDIDQLLGPPEHSEAWDNWQELYYLVPSNRSGQTQKCLLVFDYNLLQYFEIAS